MRRFMSAVVLFMVIAVGCIEPPSQGSTASLPVNDVTRSMIGTWASSDGEVALIISQDGERVVIDAPPNDTWLMDVSAATIVGDTIQFVQKGYLRTGEFHPFNGIACNSVIRKADSDKLEFGVTTVHTPELEKSILTRIK